ncbi:MAG: phosphate/phosphite/phosphonate ABC transporter substrate-binding protein [Gammaproteobacteria bacterium]|nr:phosphate/phosphite/phosphonate ABC transporter substrate-binding protein [Gammaproteobacteria bacterium]MBL6998410.1 phosphate/phosphite/phosphonate ABC transporter substrate-binding protein [Gammaproteobacteria bacterium]
MPVPSNKYDKSLRWALSLTRCATYAVLLLLSLCTLPVSAAAVADNQNYLRFGVLPLQSPTKLASMFLPVTDYLGKKLGRPVQFVTAPNFSSFMQRVARREYDLIYLNPLLYRRSRESGYRAIVKVADEPFTGILVVQKNSPIKSLSAQSLPPGTRIGFPDPDAFAATVMTRQYLQNLGIDVEQQMHVQYFGSQDSALLALHSSLVDIIGTWRPSFRSMPQAMQQSLTIIAETPPQPQMPIALVADLAPELSDKIRQVLLQMSSDSEGAGIVARLGFSRGFELASDAEYLELGE